MGFNSSTSAIEEAEANLHCIDLTPEESATINGGFFKKIFRKIDEGVGNWILDKVRSIAINPWKWGWGGNQQDVYDLDGWNKGE